LPDAVLVTRLDSLGDMILAGPAIRAVRDAGHAVHVLCGPRGRAAAELLPGVTGILEFEAPWIDPDPGPARRADADRLVDEVRHLGVAEALILGSSHQSPLPLALLLRWSGVQRIAAVSHEYPGSLLDVRLRGDPDLHEVERNLLVAEALGFPRPADDRLQVSRVPSGLAQAEERFSGDEPYVVVHPGACAPARTLSVARWREVTEALAAEGWRVLVTGSRQERRLTARTAGDQPLVFDLGGTTTLGGLAQVIGGARAFVGGNTGPMHLAAAVGTPTVAAFPPTVPLRRWRPWKVRHIALGNQAVPCAGCRSHRCPLPRQVCLDGVQPWDVVAAVAAVTRDAGQEALR
jgi:ADP-heptose:LPS heptosyltransferase